MRRTDEDEQDQQEAVIHTWRGHVGAAQALHWLRRGRALGGVVATMRREVRQRLAAHHGGQVDKRPRMGGPSAAGSPDG